MKAPERKARRAILAAGGAWFVLGRTLAFAQSAKSPRRIAILLPGTQSAYRSRFGAFRSELLKLGYLEGRDIFLEARWAEDRTERLESFAAELAALGPAVILTASSAGVAACKKATTTIPIVFATAASPVEQGFVSSLRRPGGNVTGVLVHSTERKLVEIAREALPNAKRVAILVHEPDPIHKSMLAEFVTAAGQFNFEPVIARVKRVEELALVFDEIVSRKPDALILPNLVFTFSNGP
jgi:putative ABC transport system substrate-binding protein